MSKKPLGLDKNGVQKVMRFPDYLADSLGLFSLNAVSGLVGQLTYFYTEKAGLAAASVATAFIIVKILDAFTDLIMGNIIDNTKPGRERYRPWLLKAGIPMAILVALLFMVPKGASDGLKLAYMFITNLLATAVLYTAVSIPYLSLQVVRTKSEEERATMGTFRAFAGYVSGFIVAIVVIPVTNALGGTQDAWIKVGVIFGLVIALFLLICYLRSKETTGLEGSDAEQEKLEQAEEGETLPEALKKLFKNKYWVIVLLCNLLRPVDLRRRQPDRHPGHTGPDSHYRGLRYHCHFHQEAGRGQDAAGILFRRRTLHRAEADRPHQLLVQQHPWHVYLLGRHPHDVPVRRA